jgi:universal stress protein A
MYRHILAAIDLSPEASQVLEKTKGLAQSATTIVTLMHVVEPAGYAFGGDIPLDISEITGNLVKRARDNLTALAEQHHLANAVLEVAVGRSASELHAFAEEHHVDLIVVGSHGRSGLQLLLGSTANSVLHGAKCDVLAVRIRIDQH